MAKSALQAQKHRLSDPGTYKKKRGAVILKFQIGDLPEALMHKRTPAQLKADNTLAWKAQVRLGRAIVAMALERLDPKEIKKPRKVQDAKAFRNEAERGE